MSEVESQLERLLDDGEILDALIEFCAIRGAACDNDGDILGVDRWERWAMQFEKLSAGTTQLPKEAERNPA